MSDQYVGEIRMFAGNYAPQGWAFCNGQALSISEYQALYTLLGTTYGGDGTSTFCVPDLRGRVSLGASTTFPLAANGGQEEVTLVANQMPVHAHQVQAASVEGNLASPANAIWAANPGNSFATEVPQTVSMSPAAIQPTGGSQPHENRMPFLAISFIIALEGIWPSPQ